MTATLATILEYLNELAQPMEAPPAEAVFKRLLEMFDAQGVGFFSPDKSAPSWSYLATSMTPPDRFPWQADPTLVARLRASLNAHVYRDSMGTWVLCLVSEPRSGEPLIAWQFRAPVVDISQPSPVRSDEDGATGNHDNGAVVVAWPMIAQVLVRWWAQRSPPAQHSIRRDLEQTARLTSRLSHDFGNYLTGIQGFTELSLAQAPADSLLSRHLKEVLQAARQGAAWIRRLHFFCRRSDQMVWPCELASVLAEVREKSPADWAANWSVTVPQSLPLLAIDAASLQTALEELTDNAREASQGRCRLTFAATAVDLSSTDCEQMLGSAQPGPHVELMVSDDGPGLSDEMRGKIFREPFVSSKPRHRGLGFLVVYGITTRFNGAMRIEAGQDGTGNCVKLYLPAVPVAAAAAPNQEGEYLMIVHPDHLVCASMRKLLESQGYRVAIAPTAQAAITIYRTPQQKFSLVLAETTLPHLSGFDVARRILDQDPQARFVFLHTSSTFHGLAEEEMLKRFELLRWPVAPATVLEAVRAALGDATRAIPPAT